VAAPTCFKHPDRETHLSCGRCGRPLCPDCVHHGATGVRCQECLRPTPRERGLASREEMRRAGIAAMLASGVGALLLGILGWVSVLPALALGLVVGSAAFVASKRHRDAAVQGLAAGAALLGVVLAVVVESIVGSPGGGGDVLRQLVAVSYWQVFGPALAAMAGAIIRFLL
jgi:hypothetical protein